MQSNRLISKARTKDWAQSGPTSFDRRTLQQESGFSSLVGTSSPDRRGSVLLRQNTQPPSSSSKTPTPLYLIYKGRERCHGNTVPSNLRGLAWCPLVARAALSMPIGLCVCVCCFGSITHFLFDIFSCVYSHIQTFKPLFKCKVGSIVVCEPPKDPPCCSCCEELLLLQSDV